MDYSIFKSRLEEERQKLINDLSSLGVQDKRNKDDWSATEDFDIDQADEGEVAEVEEEFSKNKALILSLNTRLKEVNSALKKIDDGTYGVCSVCNNPIESDRLEANPASITCKLHM